MLVAPDEIRGIEMSIGIRTPEGFNIKSKSEMIE
jgi:hypothetical protein